MTGNSTENSGKQSLFLFKEDFKKSTKMKTENNQVIHDGWRENDTGIIRKQYFKIKAESILS